MSPLTPLLCHTGYGMLSFHSHSILGNYCIFFLCPSYRSRECFGLHKFVCFLEVLPLLMCSALFSCGQIAYRMLLQLSQGCWDLLYILIHDQFWRWFHRLRRKCVLKDLDIMFCRCPLCPIYYFFFYFTSKVSHLIFDRMTSILVWVGYWSHLLSFYWSRSVVLDLVVLTWNSVNISLMRIFLELYFLSVLFFWWMWRIPYLFWLVLFWSRFGQLLFPSAICLNSPFPFFYSKVVSVIGGVTSFLEATDRSCFLIQPASLYLFYWGVETVNIFNIIKIYILISVVCWFYAVFSDLFWVIVMVLFICSLACFSAFVLLRLNYSLSSAAMT